VITVTGSRDCFIEPSYPGRGTGKDRRVVCDNTASHAEQYRGLFEFVNDPKNRFRTMTVPFAGGLELTVLV